LLSAEPDGEGIRFDVSDRGPGVPESFRKKIFEKYVQIPGQKGRRKGTGLGLALVRLVGEAHHGRLWVDPRAGGGSIFSMYIPGEDN
jgi:signal transduction histidine kinase